MLLGALIGAYVGARIGAALYSGSELLGDVDYGLKGAFSGIVLGAGLGWLAWAWAARRVGRTG